LLAKAALRFGAGRQGLRQCHGNVGFGAFENLRTVEVSAIGNGCQLLRLQNQLRLLGHVRQLRAVRAAGHRAGVGIGERHLLVRRCEHLRLDDGELGHLLLELGKLLLQTLRLRGKGLGWLMAVGRVELT
jgi:hypothetical protein